MSTTHVDLLAPNTPAIEEICMDRLTEDYKTSVMWFPLESTQNANFTDTDIVPVQQVMQNT